MSLLSINEEYIRKKCYESESLTGGGGAGEGGEEAGDAGNEEGNNVGIGGGGCISYFDCDVIGDSCSGGCKIILTIVTTKFENVSLIKRHRIINEIFAIELKNNSIHALTIKGSYTPKQWEIKLNKMRMK
jgi:acid stress-induced BolA-like protein IbaG/YrbA